MKRNVNRELSRSAIDSIHSIETYEGDNFSKLVELSGLDPAKDFIGTSLNGVDFSNSDLRGFNFTNCDLTGTFGINCIYDDSTILENSAVEGSFFSLEKEQRDFFKQNHDSYLVYKRLQGEYWTNGSIWVGENLRKNSKDFQKNCKIAKFLYSSVKDQTFKNQILYSLQSHFTDYNEYKEFLISQLNCKDVTIRTIRVVIDILSSKFYKDELVKKIILHYINFADVEVRLNCIPAVMGRAFFQQNKEKIITSATEENEKIVRQCYTKHFSSNVSAVAQLLLIDSHDNSYHDYNIKINNHKFLSMIKSVIRRIKHNNNANNNSYNKTDSIYFSVNTKDTLKYIAPLEKELKKVKKEGLPLKFNYDINSIKKDLNS